MHRAPQRNCRSSLRLRTYRFRVASHQSGCGQPSDVNSVIHDRMQAWQLLTEFTKRDAKGTAYEMRDSPLKRLQLREALMLAAGQPWAPAEWNPATSSDVLMGILASDVRVAVRALRDWTEAFGVEFVPPVPGIDVIPQIAGAVFLKYNSATKICYVSSYDGPERGVLVSLGQEQLGHFPLGLFDEQKSKPPPRL